jgi:SAM-dependent methyltransferase
VSAPSDLEDLLRARELRAHFLDHTRAANARLPAMDRPRILDIGCGSAGATIELARLSGGVVVGVDTDAAALVELRRRAGAAGLGSHVELVRASLGELGFADQSFELLWAEGVLHLFDAAQGARDCHRVLRRRGHLVLHETVAWFAGAEAALVAGGLRVAGEHLLPRRCWWTDYYAPLAERIRRLRAAPCPDRWSAELARHEREIALVAADPDRFDCGFFVLRRT